jgi:hypothetical protein
VALLISAAALHAETSRLTSEPVRSRGCGRWCSAADQLRGLAVIHRIVVIDDRDRTRHWASTIARSMSETPRSDGVYPPICGHSGLDS